MKKENTRACVLNQSSHIHYYDHLSPMAVVLDIPFLFVDEDDMARNMRFYPELKGELVSFQEFNPEYLLQNWDIVLMSDLWDRHVFREKFAPLEEQYGKSLRHVHVPHGFSDKVFYIRKMANEDITFVYGDNMLDLLKTEGVFENLNQYVISGNYRYSYYKKHKEYLDRIAMEDALGGLDPNKKTILYAPTWMDLEQSTTFFDSCHHLLDNAPEDYNILVKLHPRLELDDTVGFYEILGRYAHSKNIFFVTDFPLIYPLLAKTDIYIGDMSSIGYDFLSFDRPMFFLNKDKKDPNKDRRAYLFQCGTLVEEEDFGNIYTILEKALVDDRERFSAVRKKIDRYTFGEERPFEDIRRDLFKECATPPKK